MFGAPTVVRACLHRHTWLKIEADKQNDRYKVPLREHVVALKSGGCRKLKRGEKKLEKQIASTIDQPKTRWIA